MLYRFQFDLSDIDRNIYQTLDIRVAQHPSESVPYLLTRALAYALSYQDHLEFSPGGLHDPEAPAIQLKGALNSIDLWIEIGNPSAKKLHKAGKTAKQVVVYTHKNPEALLEDIRANGVHRSNDLLLYALDAKFLEELETHLEKNNTWSLLHQQGRLDVNTGKTSLSTEVRQLSLK